MAPPVSPHIDTATHDGKTSFSYLALGDSYTIGQSVSETENYPNQVIALLKKDGWEGQLKIIATSGWTTDHLKWALSVAESNGSLLEEYNIVTLLIGVNDQYQGRPSAAYKPKFEELLKTSIRLAGNKVNHVIVISIPDWSVTPFGAGKEPDEVAKEIDAYNSINKQLSQQYGVNYIDVTPGTREAATDASLLAVDGLHYSGKEYALWAKKLAEIIKVVLR
ncbi:MAG: lysophospholipase [Chitinophagaceae bacterium]|nr:lysophospholipase [Chitinophagaceae bacterium]